MFSALLSVQTNLVYRDVGVKLLVCQEIGSLSEIVGNNGDEERDWGGGRGTEA